MDNRLKNHFIDRWSRYFPGIELPVCFFYSDHVGEADLGETVHEDRCLIGNLNRVREGFTYVYDAKSPGCPGGKRYAGFSDRLRPNFEYFLSCGIPGKLEGERYKKSPELVGEFMKAMPAFTAPGRYLVFKRIDRMNEGEEALAVIFFAAPDVLAGLFTLANYNCADLFGVITPMGSGCSAIIHHPLFEARSGNLRCVLGMFDVSARPSVPAGMLTFTVPMKKFAQMAADMDESFLVTESWDLVKKRL